MGGVLVEHWRRQKQVLHQLRCQQYVWRFQLRSVHSPEVYKYTGSQAWTVGGVIYASDGTAGTLTQTAPSTSGHFVQRVGIALANDTILIMPSMDVGTVQ